MSNFCELNDKLKSKAKKLFLDAVEKFSSVDNDQGENLQFDDFLFFSQSNSSSNEVLIYLENPCSTHR